MYPETRLFIGYLPLSRLPFLHFGENQINQGGIDWIVNNLALLFYAMKLFSL
jgi:hypothetical protein